MHGLRRSRLIVLAIGFCCALAGPVSTAQASNASIVNTFRAGNARLSRDETKSRAALNTYLHTHRARPVIAALRHEVRDMRALARAIRRESASSARGRRGKADITRGLMLIANAYSQLANEIKAAHSGHPVPLSKVNQTVATDRRGRSKLINGLRLLGVRVIAHPRWHSGGMAGDVADPRWRSGAWRGI